MSHIESHGVTDRYAVNGRGVTKHNATVL